MFLKNEKNDFSPIIWLFLKSDDDKYPPLILPNRMMNGKIYGMGYDL